MKVCSLMVGACGYDPCANATIYTDQGYCVYNNGLDIKLSDVTAVEREVSNHNIDIATVRNHPVAIEFVSELPDGLWEKCIWNLQNDSFTIYIATYMDCLALTSIIHELLHLYLIAGKGEAKHISGWFVGYDDTSKTVEDVIRADVECDICTETWNCKYREEWENLHT